MKFLKVIQYAYLVFFALFLYDAVNKWNEDRNQAYISLFFAVLAIFMYFFRKKFRKKIEDSKKS